MSFDKQFEILKQRLKEIEKTTAEGWKEYSENILEYTSEKATWPELKGKYLSLFDLLRSGIEGIRLFSSRAGEELEHELNQIQTLFQDYVKNYENDIVFLKWSKN